MPKKDTHHEEERIEGKKALINLAFMAGIFAFRYKDVLIHKAAWMLFKKAAPYLAVALLVLIGLVAGLTFVFVRIFA